MSAVRDGPAGAADGDAGSCRNCGAVASGHYCANCGQETRVALPTFTVFMREAAGRYVALDGRLWRTLWGLIARPGFLTLEYLQGRRRRYIRPARLFLVLYLMLFALIGLVQSPTSIGDQVVFLNSDEAEDLARAKEEVAAAVPGKVRRDKTDKQDKQDKQKDPDSGTSIGLDDDLNVTFRVGGKDLELPEALRRRYEHFKKLPKQEKAEQLYAGILRYGTYAMIALLPAFALLQMIVYAGRGHRYPGRPRRYAEHLVYSAHLHAFAALMLILVLVLPFGPVPFAAGAWIAFYVMRARQVVYRGRWWAGLVRALIVVTCYSLLIACAVLGLVAAAVMLR